MSSSYGQKSFLVAVQSGKGHICFTKPVLLKTDCEILGWRFIKFWFFYEGFTVSHDICKARSRKVSGTFEIEGITAARPMYLWQFCVIISQRLQSSRVRLALCRFSSHVIKRSHC